MDAITGQNDTYAVISSCGRYRYELGRRVAPPPAEEPRRTILWVMLNPSTADAAIDDMTIRRCREFSRRWGFHRMLVGNLFAWRATDPLQLTKAQKEGEDIVGPENNARLMVMAGDADMALLAWGNHAELFPKRAERVREQILGVVPTVHVLGYTGKGHPVHPARHPYMDSQPWSL